MHTKSGLLEDLPNGIPLADAERQALEYIRQYVPESRKAPLAGDPSAPTRRSSTGTCPISLSTCTTGSSTSRRSRSSRAAGIRAPISPSPKKAGGHRALADILESIDELRYYRWAAPAEPGPDSASARRKAAEVLASPTTLPPPTQVTGATYRKT